jgi:hypothetical protein
MASFRAQLSPNEETTLHRIVAGTAHQDDLREADVNRLIALGLAQEIDGQLTITKHGLERCSVVEGEVLKPAVRRRLKARKLPF